MINLLDFKELFKNALNKRHVLCFFCRCEVLYEGRAESYLAEGDRVVIVKSDRTLLVHQPEGQQPINYMKQNTQFSFEDNVLLCSNQSFSERMEIKLHKIYDASSYRIEDNEKLSLFGNEKDMSDMIKNNPSIISNDFRPISREEHIKFGFIDVFGHDRDGNLIVIECKRFAAGLKDIGQLRRYVEKMKRIKGIDNVKGVLASPAITSSAKEMLDEKGYKWVRVEPPRKREFKVKGQPSLNRFIS